MRQRELDPTHWRPSPVHDALLGIALAPTDEVPRAWARHRGSFPVDALEELDWGARRLVPLVAWRLREAGVDGPDIGALRADLAASMLAARARLESFASVLATLEEAGVEALVLKGVGIASLAYPDPGTRPANDLDVLVRPAQMAVLYELVARRGGSWSYEMLNPALRDRYQHGAEVRLDADTVDVHWRLLADRYDPTPDEALFARARSVPVGTRPARTLSVEDHLVHAVAHGVRRNSLAPVRWIADVARLVECQPVDWSLVEEEAARRHVAGVLGEALSFLRTRYAVPVPSATLEALRRTSGWTRGRADLWSRSPKRTRVGGALNLGVVHYVLATKGWKTRQRLARYPQYLRFRMAVGDRDMADVRPHARWYG